MLSWELSPIADEPVNDATLLGLGERIDALYRFLYSHDIITPSVIAINGEWGSGKTSLIYTLQKKIEADTNDKKIITVSFDAWKYEYSDPALGLFYKIANKLASQKQKRNEEFKKTAREVIELAADIFTRHYTGMTLDEVKKHIKNDALPAEDLSKKLADLVKKTSGDKKIVVFIDDLDRCSLENVLTVLDALKLFLNINNFIFIIAVDISKIKLAWSYRYGKIDNKSDEGLKYLEKIIQIETKINSANTEQIKEYVRHLNQNIPPVFIDLISVTEVKNPRRIKRLLNLVALRKYFGDEKVGKLEIVFLWTIFEEIVGPTRAFNFYKQANGASQFYDFLNRFNKIEIRPGMGDDDKRRLIMEGKGYDHYVDILHDNKMLGYMEHSAKILDTLRMNKQDITNIIEEVVNYSSET